MVSFLFQLDEHLLYILFHFVLEEVQLGKEALDLGEGIVILQCGSHEVNELEHLFAALQEVEPFLVAFTPEPLEGFDPITVSLHPGFEPIDESAISLVLFLHVGQRIIAVHALVLKLLHLAS